MTALHGERAIVNSGAVWSLVGLVVVVIGLWTLQLIWTSGRDGWKR